MKLYRKRKKQLGTRRLIAFAFLGIIFLGACLLSLPIASRDGRSCGFWGALFTATSATCVTGLSLYDTWTQWSGFGQAILLILIETGGMGFMSIACLVIFALRKKVSMRQQMVMADAIGVESLGDIFRIQRRLLFGCVGIEAIGAGILFLRFLPVYGAGRAAWLGIFHSVSAFCNAGFDIMGFEQPGSSMILWGYDPVVCLTLSALIILGGLGFFVWDEVIRVKTPKRWSVYTKLVLITSGALLLSGTILFCLTEWTNTGTMGSAGVPQKVLAGFFQSVTTRTAGFAGIDQGNLTEAGKAISMFYMLIGGSSGSTAGGLKTVTFIVMVLFLWTRAKGEQTVHVFNRSIPDSQVLNALTIFGIMILLGFVGAVVLTGTSGVSFTDALYEAISALATVGLTTGITQALAVPAQALLILYMYFGRVGVLTISLGFLQGREADMNYKYAETNLLIG